MRKNITNKPKDNIIPFPFFEKGSGTTYIPKPEPGFSALQAMVVYGDSLTSWGIEDEDSVVVARSFKQREVKPDDLVVVKNDKTGMSTCVTYRDAKKKSKDFSIVGLCLSVIKDLRAA